MNRMRKVIFLMLFVLSSTFALGQEHEGEDVQVDTSKSVVVESMPSFKNGIKGLKKYVKKNLKYPKTAKEDKVEGRVLVEFVVSKTGSVKDVVISEGVREDLDSAALELVLSMPKWQPGLQDGSPVDVRYMIPINYRLK